MIVYSVFTYLDFDYNSAFKPRGRGLWGGVILPNSGKEFSNSELDFVGVVYSRNFNTLQLFVSYVSLLAPDVTLALRSREQVTKQRMIVHFLRTNSTL